MIETIYFAGPDVFRPDMEAWRSKVITLCGKHGVTPLLPCDGTESDAEAIRNANLKLLCSASAVIANLSPFRGTEVDTGTAFEVGYACALQKPTIGFIADIEPIEDRVARLFGPLIKSKSGSDVFAYRDRDGFGVEAFCLPANLMIAAGIHIVAGDEDDALAALLGNKWALNMNEHEEPLRHSRAAP